MKSFFIVFNILFLSITMKSQNIIYQSQYSFEETLNKLKHGILAKNINIFAEIDHSKEAEQVGLPLNKTKVLILGNPQVGTAIMQDNLYTAIELPLKILILEKDNKTEVVYKKLTSLSNQYHLMNTKILDTIDENMTKLIGNILNN